MIVFKCRIKAMIKALCLSPSAPCLTFKATKCNN